MVVSTWRAVTYIIQPLCPAARSPARRPPGLARALRGVLLPPEITCLSPNPPGSLRDRIWRGRDLKEEKEKKKNPHIDLVVLYLPQSTVVKKLETEGQRGAEGTLSGRTGCSPSVAGVGGRWWNLRNLHPSRFGSNCPIFRCH